MKAGITGLLFQSRSQLSERLVQTLPEFRGNHGGKVELGTLRAISLLEFGKIFQCLLLVMEPGVSHRSILEGDGSLRSLLDHDVEVVEGLLIVPKLVVRLRPGEPGIRVVRLCLERGFRRFDVGGGTFLPARRRDRRGDAQVDQRAAGMLGKFAGQLRLIEILMIGRDFRCAKLLPDTAKSVSTVSRPHDLHRDRSHPASLEPVLRGLVLNVVGTDLDLGFLFGTGFLHPDRRIAIGGLAVLAGRHVPGDIDREVPRLLWQISGRCRQRPEVTLGETRAGRPADSRGGVRRSAPEQRTRRGQETRAEQCGQVLSSCWRACSGVSPETIRQFRPSRAQTAATRTTGPSANGRNRTGR